jgi:large subunit ribosomal protein L4
VDGFTIDAPKTKLLLEVMSTLGASEGALIVLGERSDQLFRAARNLDHVHVVTPNGLNLLDILRLPRLIMSEAAIEALTRTLTTDLAPAGAVEASPE